MNAVAEGEADAPSKPVILHLVGGDFALGGLMSFVRDITREPLPGFDQFVWKYRKYPRENSAIVSLGWSKNAERSIPGDVMGAVLDVIPLYFWLRKRRVMIFHAHSRLGLLLSAIVGLVRSIPVISTVHAQRRHTGMYRVLWRLTGATVVFNSRATCLHYGYAPDAAHILTPTIRWPGPPQAGGGRFVVSSHIVRLKNIHLIVTAFLEMAQDGQSLHIYGFSPDVPEPDYQEEIARLAKPHPNIRLHQWNPQWADSLCEDDIFVHAAEGEAFGIVMLEAYSRGCRMVVPMGTFLEDLPCAGVFRSPPDSSDLAKTMAEAFAFPTSVNLWQQRQPMASQFSINDTRQAHIEIYKAKIHEN
ncbi:MAG TPA: glycosyltransferase [Verrucomicrobiae bacterium]|jgi:glycosyltransferase involved in cell wall biosynthesis